jgi:hypothetical protein
MTPKVTIDQNVYLAFDLRGGELSYKPLSCFMVLRRILIVVLCTHRVALNFLPRLGVTMRHLLHSRNFVKDNRMRHELGHVSV